MYKATDGSLNISFSQYEKRLIKSFAAQDDCEGMHKFSQWRRRRATREMHPPYVFSFLFVLC